MNKYQKMFYSLIILVTAIYGGYYSYYWWNNPSLSQMEVLQSTWLYFFIYLIAVSISTAGLAMKTDDE